MSTETAEKTATQLSMEGDWVVLVEKPTDEADADHSKAAEKKEEEEERGIEKKKKKKKKKKKSLNDENVDTDEHTTVELVSPAEVLKRRKAALAAKNKGTNAASIAKGKSSKGSQSAKKLSQKDFNNANFAAGHFAA